MMLGELAKDKMKRQRKKEENFNLKKCACITVHDFCFLRQISLVSCYGSMLMNL